MKTSIGRSCASTLVMVLGMAASERADADFITYSVQLSSNTQLGLFPEFDPALGTLTEVNLTASGGAGATVQFTEASITGTFILQVDLMFINLSVGSTGEGNFTSDPISFTTDASGRAFLGSDFSISASAAPLSFFIASSGDVALINLQIASTVSITSPAGSGVIIDQGAEGTAVVTYVFTPVPEPSSLALCGVAGLSGLGYARGHRRRVANS